MSANTSHSSSSTLHRQENESVRGHHGAQELVDSEMPRKPDSSKTARSYANFRLRDPISSTPLQIRSPAGTARSGSPPDT